MAGARPIGYLIPFKPRSAQQLVGKLIFGSLAIIIRRLELTGGDASAHLRMGFDRQCVGGDMVHAQTNGRSHAVAPVLGTLPGAP